MLTNLSLTLNDIKNIVVMILDILIIWFIIYYALRIVNNNNRTTQIFKGILFLVIVNGIAKLLNLKTLQFILDIFINWGFLAFIIIFQPEIRSLLERMGKTNVFSRMTTLTGGEKESLVSNIVNAVMLMSANRTGALISLEQSESLEDYIQTGTRMNSDVTAELLTSIFVTTTPLHDGAVIIQGDKIACASAYFPPTNLDLPSRYGARHRAAIGISEVSDAVTIVVSEETGDVSVTENGQLRSVNREELYNYLMRIIVGETTEVSHAGNDRKIIVEGEPKKENLENTSLLSKLAIKKQEDNSLEEEIVEEAIEDEAEDLVTAEEVVVIPKEEKSYDNFEEANQAAKEMEIKLPRRDENEKPKRMSREEVEALRQASLNKLKKDKDDDLENTRNTVIRNDDDEEFDTSMINISKIVGFENELDEQFDIIEQLDETKTRNEEE